MNSSDEPLDLPRVDDSAVADATATATATVTDTRVAVVVTEHKAIAIRGNDPLGLGLSVIRPAPHPDPAPYDADADNKYYARALLSPEELNAVKEECDAHGFMTINDVRKLISDYTPKSEIALALTGLDPEIMMVIDARINYKIFIADDNVYTRDELYAAYPFAEFNVMPESIFTPQEIGVFPPRRYAIRPDELEYLARDADDETFEFIMLEDLVGAAARDNYVAKRAPLRIVKTKIYLGKQRWDDFALMHRLARGAVHMTNSNESGGAPMLFPQLCGAPSPRLLTDDATAERLRAANDAAVARREADLARREEEAKRREEEAKRREEDAKRREEEISARIATDLKRVETMLAEAAAMRAAAAKAPKKKGTGSLESTTPAHPRAYPPAPTVNPSDPTDDSIAIGDL